MRKRTVKQGMEMSKWKLLMGVFLALGLCLSWSVSSMAAGKVYWKNGFRFEYKPENTNYSYKLRIRTAIQMRYTYVDADNLVTSNSENYSAFTMRRCRILIDGTAPTPDWKYALQLQVEKTTYAMDAFLQWQKYSFARVQFGRMKIPYSIEFWQSGFAQDGTDRTIFTGDSEQYTDVFGTKSYDYPGGNTGISVGSNYNKTSGFATGGLELYRSQGVDVNGYVDLFGMKQFLAYWVGVYNGRDTKDYSSSSPDMLYCFRVGINFLPGSDPKGPMGKTGFRNYTTQGDYYCNTKPLAAFIVAGFTTKNRMTEAAVITNGVETTVKNSYDTANYGFDSALLFRYMGFSCDLEGAWEEFVRNPNASVAGIPQRHWDKVGGRLNLGYFIVPKKIELTAKYAYLQRIYNNDAVKSLESGLGLVETSHGLTVEKSLQQYILGANYYLDGFNQMVAVDVAWMHRNLDGISAAEAAEAGLNAADVASSTASQNDYRFRVMYQFRF